MTVQVELDPISLSAAVARLKLVDQGGERLVARSPAAATHPGVVRVGVLCPGGAPRLLVDAFMREVDIDALCDELSTRGPVRRAEWRAAYGPSWRLAWTLGPGPCEVLGEAGPVARADSERISVVAGDVGYARGEVRAVEAFLSLGWRERGVRLLLEDGSTPVVVLEEEPLVAVDPTYGEAEARGDVRWAISLAKALAEALGVPCELSPSLA